MKNVCFGAISALGLCVLCSAAQAGSAYVQSVEQKLVLLGYNPGLVDGSFDNDLKAALRQFQQNQGLPVDGLLTRETYEAIVNARPLAPAAAPAPAPALAAPAAVVSTPVYSAPVASAPTQLSVPSDPAPAVEAGVAEQVPVQTVFQKPSRVVYGLLEAAAEFGGEKAATFYYTDGSSSSVKAGQGLVVAGGLAFNLDPAFDLRFTGGYKFTTTKDKNSDAGLERFLLKATGNFLSPSGFRIGGGLAYHTGIKLDLGGFGDDVKFKSAAGFIVEGGWKWFALTYTGIDYKTNQQDKIKASNIGGNFTWKF